MSLTAKQTGGSFNPAPQGTFIARCVQIIDLGTQYSNYYGTSKHKVLIGWELPTELNDEGEPFLVWKRYTLSLHQNSGLRKDLESWRSKPFTAEELSGFVLVKLAGVPCLVNITHRDSEGTTYADVNGVMALPKGTAVPLQVHKTVVFDIDEWDDSIFDTFSDNLKATIKNAAEVKNPSQQREDPEVQDQHREEDSIPF